MRRMLSLPTSLHLAWMYLVESAELQLFTASCLLLIIGMFSKVRMDALAMERVGAMKLRTVERKHPHLPRMRTVAGVFLCSAILLVAIMISVNGVPPFDQPMQWLMLVALFIIGGSLGGLAELRWRQAGEYTFAVIVGTTLAGFFLCYKFLLTQENIVPALGTLGLLVICLALALKTLYRSWGKKGKLLSLATYMFWFFLYIRQ